MNARDQCAAENERASKASELKMPKQKAENLASMFLAVAHAEQVGRHVAFYAPWARV